MAINLTPEGQRAYAILAQAQADHGRIGEARKQIGDLARPLPDGSQALREVQDAAGMLSRLAGTVQGPPAGAGGPV